MGGWHVLIWLVTCISGALLFLGIVAAELDSVSESLRQLEGREKKARQRRTEEAEAYDSYVAEAAA